MTVKGVETIDLADFTIRTFDITPVRSSEHTINIVKKALGTQSRQQIFCSERYEAVVYLYRHGQTSKTHKKCHT